MADSEREYIVGFTDKRRPQGATASVLSNAANYDNVPSLRTRLAAINGTYYTTALLNTMTKNDMVYAVRQADDAAGIV